jgi:hypothetical protein
LDVFLRANDGLSAPLRASLVSVFRARRHTHMGGASAARARHGEGGRGLLWAGEKEPILSIIRRLE